MSEVDVHTNGHASLQHQQSSITSDDHSFDIGQSQPAKRKVDDSESQGLPDQRQDKRRKGTAPIKDEFLVKDDVAAPVEPRPGHDEADDDAAEAFHHQDRQSGGKDKKNKRQKSQGQNKARQFGSSRDEVGLCSSITHTPEFAPLECSYGAKCRFDHDLRKYLNEHKRQDLTTFNSLCPVFETRGKCSVGWKCRFVGSHSKEITHEDGRKELVLIEDPERMADASVDADEEDPQPGVANSLRVKDRINLSRRNFETPKSDVYIPKMEAAFQNPDDQGRRQKEQREQQQRNQNQRRNSSSPEPQIEKQDRRAEFVESPLRASEKRRLYFGPETPILAPLTTQGNLPYRRLCSSLGATFTYSEMAMSMPLLQGQKSEWALIKAHESEILPPTFTPAKNIVYDYNQATDLKFGAQIAASKPWLAIKTTEVLTSLLPTGLRVVDLNCGCPIDLVYREGAGSALMDSPGKLERILRGMNAVSGPVPVTVKIRMGTKDKQPTAQKLVDRLVLGAEHSRGDACGVAAITLHGRSRQQRYTRAADWDYITSTAKLIKNLNERADAMADTIHEVDDRDQANGQASGATGRRNKIHFIGNGDVYSHEHYNHHIQHAGVDGVMAARGALIKPWLFEEIQSNQYLDKSSTERLRYIEQFCRYGLEAWGSDEIGVGQTRRFLLEWMSFACRYIPVGLLEYLPPNLQDRPPKYKGRDELETLMASDNYQDWVKISEMFLGPAHKDFKFIPKHKSNSYEAEG